MGGGGGAQAVVRGRHGPPAPPPPPPQPPFSRSDGTVQENAKFEAVLVSAVFW